MRGINGATMERMSLSIFGVQSGPWPALLRQGVGILLDTAIPMRDFMLKTLRMDPHYALNKVPGLFLNNAPVDDWNTELVGGGDSVGMSGTMPGLCGIALRRESPIRAFRPDLTSGQDTMRKGGVVTLKMFNFVARDCYQTVLSQGALVSARILREMLKDADQDLKNCPCSWNGEQLNVERVCTRLVTTDEQSEFFLRVQYLTPDLDCT